MSINNEATTEAKEDNQIKQHFLNDENYQLLRQCQQDIYKATEISPKVRKIVNDLITNENLEKLKAKYLKNWSN